MMNRDELRSALRVGVVNVTFTKKNGESRVMKCTTKEDMLASYNKKSADKTEAPKEIDPDLFKVTEITDNGSQWRSFNFTQVTNTEV